jgi:hypothetical protein
MERDATLGGATFPRIEEDRDASQALREGLVAAVDHLARNERERGATPGGELVPDDEAIHRFAERVADFALPSVAEQLEEALQEVTLAETPGIADH